MYECLLYASYCTTSVKYYFFTTYSLFQKQIEAHMQASKSQKQEEVEGELLSSVYLQKVFIRLSHRIKKLFYQ